MLDSRLTFAFRILAVSQIIFFGLSLVAIVVTAGFALFIVPLLVFCNILSAVVIFILALLQYSAAKGWVVKDKIDPLQLRAAGFKDILLGLSALIIPVIMFVLFNGSSVMNEMFDAIEQATGSTALIELQLKLATKEYRKDALYSKLAFLKKDPSICRRVSEVNKIECIAYSDTEILDSKTCAIRKRIDGQYADLFVGRVRTSCLREREGQVSTNLPVFVPTGYLLVPDNDAMDQNPHIVKAWRIDKENNQDKSTVIQLLKWDFAACAMDAGRCALAYDPVTDDCRVTTKESTGTYPENEGIYGISICKSVRPYRDIDGSASVSAVLAEKDTHSLYSVTLTQWGTAHIQPSISTMNDSLTKFIEQSAGQ